MDIIDKIKQYNPLSPATPVTPKCTLNIGELCQQVGGSVLNPPAEAVIRIETKHPYSLFSKEPEPIFGTTIQLPFLTRGEFCTHLPLSEILLFDLETTGLAGGTGTYPFLLGFGIFNEEGIVIVQYFLPDFGLENGAFLELINSYNGNKILVSFNGKSFDYPLLSNRFIINRLDNPFKTFRHLDLLHPARRVWKTVLESCSLEQIETNIFNISRQEDIYSALIPQVYFEFLQHGSAHDIRRVINHNQQDILSLGRLLLYFNWLENTATEQMLPEQELQNLCHLAISNFDLDRSVLFLDQIRRKGKNPSDFTLTLFSLLLKRFGRWHDAESIWQELIHSSKNTLFAAEELAKYYEHHQKDLVKALQYTEHALEYLEIVDELAALEDSPVLRIQFTHRLSRLQRKMTQQNNNRSKAIATDHSPLPYQKKMK